MRLLNRSKWLLIGYCRFFLHTKSYHFLFSKNFYYFSFFFFFFSFFVNIFSYLLDLDSGFISFKFFIS